MILAGRSPVRWTNLRGARAHPGSDGAEHVRLGWTDAAEPRMVVTDGYDDEAKLRLPYIRMLLLLTQKVGRRLI